MSRKTKERRGGKSKSENISDGFAQKLYRGDKFIELVMKHTWPGVRRHIQHLLYWRNGPTCLSAVDDIASEILKKLFSPSNNMINTMAELETTPERLRYYRNYLYRAAHNGAINWGKKRVNERCRHMPLDILEAEASGDGGELQRTLELKQAIRMLPQPEQDVFTLIAVRGLHYRDAEEHFNHEYSVNSLKHRYIRARIMLKKILGLGPEDTSLYEKESLRALLDEEGGEEGSKGNSEEDSEEDGSDE